MLMNFISGGLEGLNGIRLASKIVRVIVAGNSVVANDVTKGKDRWVARRIVLHFCFCQPIFIIVIASSIPCKPELARCCSSMLLRSTFSKPKSLG